MPDPIWVDTNVLVRITRGDTALEGQLIQLRAKGVQLLIPPAANQELLYGNPLTMDPKLPAAAQQPSEASRAQIRQLMKRLDITVDMAGGSVPQSQRVGDTMQEHVKPKLNDIPANVPRNSDGTVKVTKSPRGGWTVEKLPQSKQDNMVRVIKPDQQGKVVGPGRNMIASHPSLDKISESDRLVLSQIKAGAQARGVKNPVIFTAETGQKGMIGQAHVYGIKPMQPAPAASGSPPPVAPAPPPAPPAAPPKTLPAGGGAPAPATAVKTVSAKGGAPTVKTVPARGGAPTPATAVKTVPARGGAPAVRMVRAPTPAVMPAPSVGRPPIPGSGGLPYAARMAMGVRIAGGFILMAALQVLGTWLKNRLDGMYIKSEIERLEPKIQAVVAKRTEEIARVQVNGDKAYAIVTVVVLKVFAGGMSQGLPQVWFGGLDIQGRAVNTIGQTAAPPMGWTAPWMQRIDHIFSFEVSVFSDEDLKELADLMLRFQELSIKLRGDPFDDDLRAERQAIRKAIIEKFGPNVGGLNVEASEMPRY